MNTELLHSIFNWVAIGAIALSLISAIGIVWTGKIIDYKKDAEIAKLQPRILSNFQKTALLEKISQQKGRIGFISLMMDGESLDFADELADVFKKAGWNLAPTIRTSLNDFPGFLSIFVTGQNLDASASLVCRSFQEINIDCRSEKIEGSSIGGVRELDTVYVVVGRKASN